MSGLFAILIDMQKPRKNLFPKLAVVLLIATYIALSTASAFTTRLRYGPDEPAHFIYIREIGQYMRLPLLTHEETHVISLHKSHEAHQPPLYYMLAAVPFAISRALGADINTTWMVLRLFTVLLGACWVYFLYRLSGEVLGDKPYAAVLSAACVALLPLSTYTASVVNNDIAIALFFTIALWLMIKAIKNGSIDRKAGISIGVAIGLAILTKAQGLLLLPILAVAVIIIGFKKGWEISRQSIINSVITLLIASLVSFIWFFRNWYVYKSFITQTLHNPLVSSATTLGISDWIAVVWLATNHLFLYLWTPFWLLSDMVNPEKMSRLLLALCLVVFLGVIVHIRISRGSKLTELEGRADVWAFLLMPWLVIYVSWFRHTLLIDKGASERGSLFLPAAIILGLAMVVGLRALIERPVTSVVIRLVGLLKRGKQLEYKLIKNITSAILGLLLFLALVAANIAVLKAIGLYYELH